MNLIKECDQELKEAEEKINKMVNEKGELVDLEIEQ